jgi:replication factor C large subunit
MSELWVEKHRPRKLDEVMGQTTAVQQMKMWAQGWAKGKPAKKALLVYGATGTGKSAAASTLAREFGWDLLEMNASDERTLKEIQRIAGTAATSGTLVGGAGGRRLVVLDEADNVHGTADRGGYKAIKELIEQTQNPVILVANDQYEIPWDIRASCLAVNFRRLTKDVERVELMRIARAEGFDAEIGAVEKIAETSSGDLRSAVQDFQVLASGRKSLKEKDVIEYRRDREKSIFDFLGGILSARSAKEVREVLWAIDMPPDDVLAWVEENIPRMVADPVALAQVYDAISRADIFLGRAKRGQAYGLWSYASDLMSSGVAMRRGERIKREKFQPPGHIRRYAYTRGARALRDSAARKVGGRCHTSAKVAKRDVLPYLGMVLKHDRRAAAAISAELELSNEEQDFIKSSA